MILVKLDNPKGSYYGGKTAAPVSKIVLEAAIAARDAAIDRNALTRRRNEPVFASRTAGRRPAADTQKAREITVAAGSVDEVSGDSLRDPGESASVPFVVSLADRHARTAAARFACARFRTCAASRCARRCTRCTSPGSACSSVRAPTGTTAPEAGTPLRTGSIVRLYHAAMTPFASRVVRDALARAGVLREVRGTLPDELTGITDDSRQVGPGSLFVAVRGTARDGHDFLSGDCGSRGRGHRRGRVAHDACPRSS